MNQYLKLLKLVLQTGDVKNDRTGVGTKSIFGHQMKYSLEEGFPLLTTKKLHFKSVIHELLWFIKGDTNIKYLNDNGVNIWNEWADKNGNLGPVYGKQWRSWTGNGIKVDQLKNAIDLVQNNPNSRRIIVSSWNPLDIDKMALPPCHCLFQFYVVNNKLSCQLYQRSADIFLGLPFNIASYALLTHMIAKLSNLDVGAFIHASGDAHIYLNHIEQAAVQLKRKPKKLPNLFIKKRPRYIEDFKFEDFEIIDYQFHPHIPAPVAV